MKIKIARSPDSDDAFMLYALEQGKIETGIYEFESHFADIQSLNEKAKNSCEYDISAISFHAYTHLDENYELLKVGSSFGDNYGPLLISANNSGLDAKELLHKIKTGQEIVAIPGNLTSASLALKLYAPSVQTEALPFSEIKESILKGQFKAGLIIHEEQLTYKNNDLLRLLNLGEWWFERTGGLPLPLGANIIKRNLKTEVKKDLQNILKQSIEYAFNNREAALHYALKFSNGLLMEDADRFVSMYVNELSLDWGLRGQKSIELFFKEAYQLGFIPKMPELTII